MDQRHLYAALHQKAGFERVGGTESENQLRIIGRVPQIGVQTWLEVMRHLNMAARDAPWNCDTSKQYFIRDGSDKQLYCWRVILQGDNITEHVPSIVQIVMNVPQQAQELSSMPIQRSSSRNRMTDGGKGASVIGGDAGVPPIIAARMGRAIR